MFRIKRTLVLFELPLPLKHVEARNIIRVIFHSSPPSPATGRPTTPGHSGRPAAPRHMGLRARLWAVRRCKPQCIPRPLETKAEAKSRSGGSDLLGGLGAERQVGRLSL